MKVLWLPIFSMRSYDTNKYAICKDGNFQLTLSRVLASDFDSLVIGIPDKCSDFLEFTEQYSSSIFRNGRDVTFNFFEYGENAVDTRKKFWDANQSYFKFHDGHNARQFDLLITDITGYEGTIPFINNFNITKLPQLVRPYIDQFFDIDLKSIERSLFTTVINQCQRDYIVKMAPHLTDKVIVDTKIAHYELMPLNHTTRQLKPRRTIFWPFRISDKAYKFEAFLEMYEREKLYHKYKLIITDPNDSYVGEHSFITKIKPSKAEYYEILQDRPIVIMLDDIDTVLHPGTIELMFYGCLVITLPNELINNLHLQVESIDQIPLLLYDLMYSDLSYNTSTDVRDFYYQYEELSAFYNEEFVINIQNK